MQTERFVKWWPQLVAYSGLVTGGAYRVPWQHAPTMNSKRSRTDFATPRIALKAKAEHIYLAQRFSDHAPVMIDYDFEL